MANCLEIHEDEEWGCSSISSIVKSTTTWEELIKKVKAHLISLSSAQEALHTSEETMKVSEDIIGKFWADIAATVHREVSRTLQAFKND